MQVIHNHRILNWAPAAGQPFSQDSLARFKFELVHESLVQNTLEYFDNVMAAIGFLLLAIGWLLTSSATRAYLGNHLAVRWSVLVAIGTLAILDLSSVYEAFEVSQKKIGLLEELQGQTQIDRRYFADDGITWRHFVVNSFVHLALFGVLMVLVYSLGRRNVNSTAAAET